MAALDPASSKGGLRHHSQKGLLNFTSTDSRIQCAQTAASTQQQLLVHHTSSSSPVNYDRLIVDYHLSINTYSIMLHINALIT